MKLTESLETDNALLRELHHRIGNNFQTIVSLIGLQTRTRREDRGEELRFIEEHVQAMAATYRIARVSRRQVEVPLEELVKDVLDSLRQIARQPPDAISLQLAVAGRAMRIDQAISFGLYLATLVPPLLDHQVGNGQALRIVLASLDSAWLRLSVNPAGEQRVSSQDMLRQRLGKIYLNQLGAQVETPDRPGATQLRIFVVPHTAAGTYGASRPA